VLDRWIHDWRQREPRGRISIVRYADDFIMGCQYEADARRVWAALQERLRSSG
jgi:RNA-directed DNA polymerase